MTEADKERNEAAETEARRIYAERGVPHWHDIRDGFLIGCAYEYARSAEELTKRDAEVERLRNELLAETLASRRLKDQIWVATEALTEIANEDFRGNRPHGSVVAFKALAKIEAIKNE